MIRDIIENASSADRQLKIFNESNDLKLVVDHLIQETSQKTLNAVREHKSRDLEKWLKDKGDNAPDYLKS